MLLMLTFVVEIAHLWVARAELENSLEAAALAAVKEWGDAGGGSTLIPRQVGLVYAAANTIDDDPVELTTNYNPDNLPNENDDCEGHLIFGAITEDRTMYAFDTQTTFNAGVQPSCGLGSVLVDATGQGNLGADNAWGVAFRDTPETPPNLTILSITIDLQAGGGNGRFDFTSFPPTLSDNLPEPIIPGRDDIFGFSDPQAQIVFSPTSGMPSSLTITFLPDPGTGGDQGFEPGDRFRFGAFVDGVSKGTGGDDGDGIGQDDVQVTVVFALGGVPLPPVTGTFFDNKETSNDCYPEPPVHPTRIPDLPCPPSSAEQQRPVVRGHCGRAVVRGPRPGRQGSRQHHLPTLQPYVRAFLGQRQIDGRLRLRHPPPAADPHRPVHLPGPVMPVQRRRGQVHVFRLRFCRKTGLPAEKWTSPQPVRERSRAFALARRDQAVLFHLLVQPHAADSQHSGGGRAILAVFAQRLFEHLPLGIGHPLEQRRALVRLGAALAVGGFVDRLDQVRRQVGGGQFARAAEQDRAADVVLQLADVSRPLVAFQAGQEFGVDAADRHAVGRRRTSSMKSSDMGTMSCRRSRSGGIWNSNMFSR